MTPLEAARRIAAVGPQEYEGICCLCQRIIDGPEATPHRDDCPWLRMPQIVAALEAAGRVIDGYDDGLDKGSMRTLVNALAAALKGEPA